MMQPLSNLSRVVGFALFLSIYVYVCLPACTFVQHIHAALTMPEGIEAPGTGVIRW